MEQVLAGLNAPQRAVATRADGPLLVVAGPGAGKTRAIAARVAHLLVARRVPGDQILAITFSRRAAGELQARLAALPDVAAAAAGDAPPPWAGTFHALGARILRHGGARLFGRPRNFTIFDQDDTERALRRIVDAMGVQETRTARLVTAARRAVSLVKRGSASADDADEVVGDGKTALPLRDVLRRYEDELREALAFDFDDLVGVANQALDRDPSLLGWAQQRARHLLVDEYQDTDANQEALILRLSPSPHDVCVVADPQQSIYAFRGAAPEQVRRFTQRWPHVAVIRLEQNYRSTKSIVAIAQRLVAPYTHGPGATLALRLWTENPVGAPARLWVAPHPEKEADAIARDVAARLEAGWRADDVAVLVRTHAQARPIEAAFLRHKVPHALVGGVRFFGREEIKDALAYVRLAALPEDTAAFWRVINTPRRGLRPAAQLSNARYALAASGGPLPATRRWAATETAPDGLYDFLAHVDELTGLDRSGAGPRAVLLHALEVTRYRDYLRHQHPDDAAARNEALDELLSIAAGYAGARHFLDDAALSTEDDDAARASTAGRVRISTVHAAKGLEFRAVYVPGCELGLFPLARQSGAAAGAAPTPSAADEGEDDAMDGEDDANGDDGADGGAGQSGADIADIHDSRPVRPAAADPEERRIFYVAVTRAREQLTLSYCTFRRDGRTEPSPYLREIGRGLIRRAKLGSDEPVERKKPAAKRVRRAAVPQA
jgi:DNA helicase-2/ATP-dependent DNA helicase PcrA